MSLNIDMKMILFSHSSRLIPLCASSVSWEDIPLGFKWFFVFNGNLKIFKIFFPRPMAVDTSFPDTARNLKKHVRLLLTRKVDLIQGVNCQFNHRYLFDLVFLVQDQFLRDVEQRLEFFEVGVLLGEQVVFVILSEVNCSFHCR